jgi:hypothetical protein
MIYEGEDVVIATFLNLYQGITILPEHMHPCDKNMNFQTLLISGNLDQ